MKPLARNGAKLLSRDKVYSKFCLQFSKLFIVSDFDKCHCFAAQCLRYWSFSNNEIRQGLDLAQLLTSVYRLSLVLVKLSA